MAAVASRLALICVPLVAPVALVAHSPLCTQFCLANFYLRSLFWISVAPLVHNSLVRIEKCQHLLGADRIVEQLEHWMGKRKRLSQGGYFVA